MKPTHANPRLPGMRLDPAHRDNRRDRGCRRADIILIATPAQNLREAASTLAPHLKTATPVIAAAKGIERGTHKFMTEVIAEAAPEAMPAILSGPSFADDVARGLPTAVTLAARDEAAGELAGAGAGLVDLPALSHVRCPRRRDRGRCKKRAGDRGRHRRRKETRRIGAGRVDHARLLRTGAIGRACGARGETLRRGYRGWAIWS